MVNPRYRPFNGNSRKPVKKQAEVVLSETKTDFVYPPKEKYIGSHIKSDLAGEPVSNESYEKYYKDLIWEKIMPGKEIKGRSKIATYRHGGRVKAADGLWANIHAKRKRIASGSGEKMRTPGAKGAPTAKALKESQT